MEERYYLTKSEADEYVSLKNSSVKYKDDELDIIRRNITVITRLIWLGVGIFLGVLITGLLMNYKCGCGLI